MQIGVGIDSSRIDRRQGPLRVTDLTAKGLIHRNLQEPERSGPLVQQRQAEPRPAGLIECQFGQPGRRLEKIVELRPGEQREQRGFIAAEEADGAVRRGIAPVHFGQEVLQVVSVAEQGQIRVQIPIRPIGKVQRLPVFQLHPVAVRIDIRTGHAGAAIFRVKVIEIIQAQTGQIGAIVEPGIRQIHAGADAAGTPEIQVPARQQPSVLVFAGLRIELAAEHNAVAVEQKRPPARPGTGHEMVSQLRIQRLT